MKMLKETDETFFARIKSIHINKNQPGLHVCLC